MKRVEITPGSNYVVLLSLVKDTVDGNRTGKALSMSAATLTGDKETSESPLAHTVEATREKQLSTAESTIQVWYFPLVLFYLSANV